MKKVYAGFLAIVLLAFSCLFAVPNGNAVAPANSWETMAEKPQQPDTEPFSTTLVVIASAASMVIIGAGFLIYLKNAKGDS